MCSSGRYIAGLGLGFAGARVLRIRPIVEGVQRVANRLEQRVNRHRERKKNVGELPHIAQSARRGAPGTAVGN